MSMCTPLQPLSAAEVFQSRDAILATAAKQGLSQHVFGYISLLEPSGDELRAFEKSGTPPARKAEAVVHLSDGAGVRKPFKAYATLKGSSAEVSLSPVDTEKGWPLFSLHECDLAEKLVMDSPEVHKLLKETYKMDESAIKRLKVDPWGIHGCHWSPVSAEAEKSRVMMCLMYLSKREDCKDNFYAHPLDFLCYVDLYEKKLLHIQKCEKGGKVPREASEYHRALVDHSKFDRSLKPLEIVQPEGPSFEVEGNGIKWNRWSLNISFNYREGLVLHNLKFDGRPVLRRACLSEMAVPYADPFPPHIHKCAFDVGDYGLGYFATSLNLGCDCLGRIHYFDALLTDHNGDPYVIPKAVCMHEEDAGLLWKHVESRTGHNESRRNRKLVISFIATVVNYEYAIYWNLYLDGTIDLEIKLTGILSTNALSDCEKDSGVPQHGTLVTEEVNAQIHQHIFCARLDTCVDGDGNYVCETELVPVEDKRDPYRNCLEVKKRVLDTEKDGRGWSNQSQATSRYWTVCNGEKKNRYGNPTAYKLMPMGAPTVISKPDNFLFERGPFTKHAVWVTPQTAEERYAAGDFTTHAKGEQGGIEQYQRQGRDLVNKPLVLWHTFNAVHVVRPEDFPVMPAEMAGFKLRAFGFFDENPTCLLPPQSCGSKSLSVQTQSALTNLEGASVPTTEASSNSPVSAHSGGECH